MKKLFIVALFVVLLISGCQSKGQPSTQTTPADNTGETATTTTTTTTTTNEQQSKYYNYGTPVTVDNVVFTITGCSVKPVKGDRTADNVADDNGEYFALGSDTVKASDYEQIEVSATIENKSDKAINFSEEGWEAKLPDGYELKNITVEGKIAEQMPSHYKADGKVIIIKEKNIDAKELQLTYYLMDYNEEWQQAIWKAVSGEMTEEEYKAKFNPNPVTFLLKL